MAERDAALYGERVGIQRATVVGDQDPLGEGRLQVSVASGGSAWATRVIPIAAFTAHHVAVGTQVWIAHEDDDAELPVVLGLVDPPSRAASLARDLEALGDAWDQGHAAGRADASGDATPNPYR
ncbi:phage baseplate assembly protein V [Microbacterium sp. P02]|uniref:phage baseplate assembly protein V n=1 Tax=Microbacterium sp. P02 TaxID=3366260 RepID=UPI00366CF497